MARARVLVGVLVVLSLLFMQNANAQVSSDTLWLYLCTICGGVHAESCSCLTPWPAALKCCSRETPMASPVCGQTVPPIAYHADAAGALYCMASMYWS